MHTHTQNEREKPNGVGASGIDSDGERASGRGSDSLRGRDDGNDSGNGSGSGRASGSANYSGGKSDGVRGSDLHSESVGGNQSDKREEAKCIDIHSLVGRHPKLCLREATARDRVPRLPGGHAAYQC